MKKERITAIKTLRALPATFGIALLAITANAQPDVTWQTPATISGTSDVNARGAYFGS